MARAFGGFVVLSTSLFMAILLAAPAVAQAQAAAPGGPPVSPLMNLVPFIVMLGIMYFLMIRPQMKKQKQHQEFIVSLKRGDEVLTSGGILGRIEGLTDLYVTLEIAPGVRIKILRSQVSSSTATVNQAADTKSEAKNEGKT